MIGWLRFRLASLGQVTSVQKYIVGQVYKCTEVHSWAIGNRVGMHKLICFNFLTFSPLAILATTFYSLSHYQPLPETTCSITKLCEAQLFSRKL